MGDGAEMRTIPYMKTPIVVALIACAGCVAELEHPTAAQESDIVGGEPTNAYPAVGALMRGPGQVCTGTLIAPRRVLTAAHCVDDGATADMFRFALGHRTDDPDELLDVVALRLHPEFDPDSLAHDIAYLTLGEDAPVAPMARNESMGLSWWGWELRFVGFGRTGPDHTGGIKRVAGMRVSWIGSRTFEYLDAEQATCQGDSGGPAIFVEDGVPRVVGVHSSVGKGCRYYGTETRVDAYEAFLDGP
jgi:secreted trypsin-like serine protease